MKSDNSTHAAAILTPTDWTQDQRERYEERAAILEFDAGHPRHWAEVLARQMVEGRYQEGEALGGEAADR